MRKESVVATDDCPIAEMSVNPKETDTPFRIRAFLSFTKEDTALADLFKISLERRCPCLEILQHPVREAYDEDWKIHCENKIVQSTILICLVGNSTHGSSAVAWELGMGLALGKRVITFNLVSGSPPVPAILKQNSMEPIGGSLEQMFSNVSHEILANAS